MDEVRSAVCVRCETHFTSPKKPGRPRTICDDCTPKRIYRRNGNQAVLCAGTCGRMLSGSPTSLPAGQRTCDDCRRAAWATDCARCGDAIPEGKRSKQRKYCSLDCYRGGHVEGAGPAIGGHRHRARGTARCAWCKEEFDWHPRYRATYCSKDCRQADRFKKTCEIPWGKCPTCFTWFVRRGKKTYCDEGCRPTVSYYEPTERTIVCETCGISFVQHMGRTRRCCSKACYRQTDDYKSARRQESRLRKRRKRQAVADGERYRDNDIFERDSWRCQLSTCQLPSRKVRRDKRATLGTKHPHPAAPVIDHVVPLAVGGVDAPHNVVCAHFLCNSHKGARATGDQLMLAVG